MEAYHGALLGRNTRPENRLTQCAFVSIKTFQWHALKARDLRDWQPCLWLCELKVSPSGMPSRVCCQHHHSSVSWPSRQRGFQELAFFLFHSRQCKGEANLPGKQCLSLPRCLFRVRIESGYSVSHLFMALIAMRLWVREDIPGPGFKPFVRYSCI